MIDNQKNFICFLFNKIRKISAGISEESKL